MSLLDPVYRRFPRVLIARRNLSRAAARSGLATLTIVIGVVAIATIGTFGMAFWESQTRNFAEIGNDVQVFAGEDNDLGYLTPEDVDRIDRATGDAEVTPIRQRTVRVVDGDDAGEGVTVYGVEDPTELYDVTAGNVPPNWRKGALVGATLAERYELEPGNKFETTDGTRRVAAVLGEADQGTIANPNEAIVLPAGSLDDESVSQVVVRADSPTEANTTARAVRDEFNRRGEVVNIFERSEVAESIQQFFTQFNLFIGGVGIVSLVVAGISITNVMLMSVIERREEIGVLRAVGYERGDVLRIVLVEAMLLGLVGSIVGTSLSFLLGMGANQLLLSGPMDWTRGALAYQALGFIFGVAVSAAGGLYPAWKGANERPVEALRG